MSPRLAFSALAVLLLSIVVSPVYARQTLENPQPDSFQSGVGVISGWACNARRIEISFNGGARLRAGTGTLREDTRGVCGDTNNGFGLLYNWNRLGDGVHTVTAYADGVEFASVQVIVTTLGEEFLRGASGTFPLTDFPTPGSRRTLRWQQAQQNFVITAGSPQGGGTSGAVPHILENPQPGSFQSGVGVISGWACNARRIEISFNGGARLRAGTGTLREDTRGVCGDTNNGFGLLYNWNRLGNGTHTVTAYADGVEFARVTVTVTTLGAEFRRGLSREVTLPNFPEDGTDVVVRWQQAQQNFVISFAAPTQRVVEVRSRLVLPSDVRIPGVRVTSVLSDTTVAVSASAEPTLILAEDAGGTVLLAVANKDGGVLGEARGVVEVSLDSTAVVLVGLVAGIGVADLTPSVVAEIQAHTRYAAVVDTLHERLRADPNFLDRLADPPETVRLIQAVAREITVARRQGSGAGSQAGLTAQASSMGGTADAFRDVLASLGQLLLPPLSVGPPMALAAATAAGTDCTAVQASQRTELLYDALATVIGPAAKAAQVVQKLGTAVLAVKPDHAKCVSDKVAQAEQNLPFSPTESLRIEDHLAIVRANAWTTCGSRVPGTLADELDQRIQDALRVLADVAVGKILTAAKQIDGWLSVAIQAWEEVQAGLTANDLTNRARALGCQEAAPEELLYDYGKRPPESLPPYQLTAGRCPTVYPVEEFDARLPESLQLCCDYAGAQATECCAFSRATGGIKSCTPVNEGPPDDGDDRNGGGDEAGEVWCLMSLPSKFSDMVGLKCIQKYTSEASCAEAVERSYGGRDVGQSLIGGGYESHDECCDEQSRIRGDDRGCGTSSQ